MPPVMQFEAQTSNSTDNKGFCSQKRSPGGNTFAVLEEPPCS